MDKMKRKLAVLVLLALVTLLAATPALAAGPRGGNGQQHQYGNAQGQRLVRQWFSLTGVITALDGTEITVQVYNGNRIAQPYIGQALTVQVTDGTRYRQWQADGCIPISFGDLVVGDTTSVQGMVSDGTFTAQRVTVDVPCCTQEQDS
jgi:hypothetical protein